MRDVCTCVCPTCQCFGCPIGPKRHLSQVSLLPVSCLHLEGDGGRPEGVGSVFMSRPFFVYDWCFPLRGERGANSPAGGTGGEGRGG